MTLPTHQALLIILVSAIATFLTRALPFFLFPPHKKTPTFILYLGKVLPFATIGMLLVYCLKDVSILTWSYGLPEAISLLAITAVHLWKRNILLSVGGGTLLYMFLVQVIF
ncbi:MAG: AzlD domain-containing protein [Clostridia bacterium]|nr:AzlD domain-containing protein [Clostridia bacterium]